MNHSGILQWILHIPLIILEAFAAIGCPEDDAYHSIDSHNCLTSLPRLCILSPFFPLIECPLPFLLQDIFGLLVAYKERI